MEFLGYPSFLILSTEIFKILTCWGWNMVYGGLLTSQWLCFTIALQ